MAPKVIVSGLLRDGLGLAEATRGYAAALAAAGCEVLQHMVRLPGRPFPLGDPGPEGVLDLPEVDADAEADLVLVCLCPPELEALAAERSILPAGRVNAGLWIWDVDPLPASWPTSPHRFDEIWSPTSYVTGLLAPVVQLPVFTAPPGLQPPRSEGTSSLLEPGRATVLVLADVASSLARKNPAGAIEAFARAFRPDEGPRLVVKIWNGDADPGGRAELEALAADRPDVVLVDRWLPRRELVALLAGSACFLSLHRAEGFGLPIFEALALGTPIVATGFSGPMDFLDGTVAHVVPATPAPVPAGVPAYPAGSVWAEPDLDRAVEALRSVWEDPAEARQRADRGRALVLKRLTPEAVGPQLRAHVEKVLERTPRRSPKAPLRPHLSVVTPVSEGSASAAEIARLRAIASIAQAAGGEVLAGVAAESTLPDEVRPPGVRVVVAGRGPEVVLRAAALADADGDFVAFIGAGFQPVAGWWDAYEKGFRQAGASLLCGPGGPPGSAVNCAMSAEVIPAGEERRPGWLETLLLPELVAAGRAGSVPEARITVSKESRCMRSYAQMAEDVRLDRVFRSQPSGFYIDVGAAHPVVDSVTRHFYDLGWRGVNVEPDVRLSAELERDRPRDVLIRAACSDQVGQIEIFETGVGEGWSTVDAGARATAEAVLATTMLPRRIPCTTLAAICAQHVTGDIDFLKIDVKGHEFQVISGGDWDRWRPRIVVVEATAPHSTFPTHVTWEPLLLDAGYIPAGFDGINRFYVLAEEPYLVDVLAAPITAIEDFEAHRYLSAVEELAESRRQIAGLEGEVGRLEAEVRSLRRQPGRLEQLCRWLAGSARRVRRTRP